MDRFLPYFLMFLIFSFNISLSGQAAIGNPSGESPSMSQTLPPGEVKLLGGKPYSVEFTREGIKIEGRYTLLRGGSVQWFRLPREVWEDRLRRYKAMGFNSLDIYIAWNQIEAVEGQFDFTKPDLRSFLELARKYGLFITVRPGPYITNEMDGGGLPAWLTRKSTKKGYLKDGKPNLRSHDPDFIEPVRRYFHALNAVLKPYTASYGGPIIIYALENEYTWFERAFKSDKLFWYQGGLERPLWDKLPTRPYFTALRDIVRETGIDLPLVTSPGDGKLSAMGDVDGIAPFPSIYEWANPGQPEEIAYDLLHEMHDKKAANGIYDKSPIGSLEVSRSSQDLRRLAMGGLDAFYIFNVAGIIQEDYLNGMTMAARFADQPAHWGSPGEKTEGWIETIFDFHSFDRILTGFVAPEYGFFGNVIDYKGALSPSGVQRDLYYEYRRDNFFFSAVEPLLAASGTPKRSGNFEGADANLKIHNRDLGARQKIGKVHYWHSSGNTAFVSLLNQTGEPLELGPGSIELYGESLPKYATMLVPIANNIKKAYAQILPYRLPLTQHLELGYTTSELLTFKEFNRETLLVVYGPTTHLGELKLNAPGLKMIYQDGGVKVRESDRNHLILTYPHEHGITALMETEGGQKLRLLVTTEEEAGRIWFLRANGKDILISGLDSIDEYVQNPDGLSLRYDFDRKSHPILVMSPQALTIAEHEQLKPYNSKSQIAVYQRRANFELPPLPNLIEQALVRSDAFEAQPDFDDHAWFQWSGTPRPLEDLDIFRGHAWYRTEFFIDDIKKYKGSGHLYIESASDFVGIYVNGQYVTTLAPVGTEINNKSINPAYQFPMLKSYLRSGRNVIAFRTEIWGHGSFMFGRGRILGTLAKLPAISYEALKGLYGKATLDGRSLSTWKIRPQLGGEIAGFAKDNTPLSSWTPLSGLPVLEKGAVLWYRTAFSSGDLPDSRELYAPIILNIEGKNSKGTLFVNGRMLGRWLSDSTWLARGSWARPQKGMWVSLNSNHFPIPREILKPAGEVNHIAIIFEDCSAPLASSGIIDKLELRYNEEGLDWKDDEYHYREGVSGRTLLNLSWQ